MNTIPTECPNGDQSSAISDQASQLDESAETPFGKETVKFQESMDLLVVAFSDVSHGWIGGGAKLYKTTDGGRSWKQVTLTVPSGAEIAQILFINSLSGWIVLKQETQYVLDYPNYKSILMHTADAGETWDVQYDDKQVSAVRVAFSDEQNGWLTGIKYLGKSGVVYSYLILRSTDGGMHWSDVSDRLTQLTSDDKDVFGKPANDGVMGLVSEGPISSYLITGQMRIMKSMNSGRSWQTFANIRDKSDDQSGIRRFGRNDNLLWVIASARSIEGTRAVLTMQESDNKWARFTLGNAYFSDVVSLSRNEFFACGFLKKLGRVGDPHKTQEVGVILYSRNAGRSWSVDYQNTNIRRINSLTCPYRKFNLIR